MVRLFIAVTFTVAVVSFATVNTHQVTLSFVVGSPVKVRLIFLLLSSFLVGMVSCGFWVLLRRHAKRRRTIPPAPVQDLLSP